MAYTTAYKTEGMTIAPDAPSYAIEIRAMGEQTFVRNGMRFPDMQSAYDYAVDLTGRWFAVEAWRMVDCFDAPNQ